MMRKERAMAREDWERQEDREVNGRGNYLKRQGKEKMEERAREEEERERKGKWQTKLDI